MSPFTKSTHHSPPASGNQSVLCTYELGSCCHSCCCLYSTGKRDHMLYVFNILPRWMLLTTILFCIAIYSMERNQGIILKRSIRLPWKNGNADQSSLQRNYFQGKKSHIRNFNHNVIFRRKLYAEIEAVSLIATSVFILSPLPDAK